MKLLHDKVLIKELKTEQKTSSGLILPESATEKEYEVLDVGNRCKALKKGDRIRLYEHAKKDAYEGNYFIRESFGIKVIL